MVAQVVEISRELCANASGAEALSLQCRTDALRQRYSKLADDAATRIAVLEKALPLAEDLKEGMAELREHLDGVEEDLRNLTQVFKKKKIANLDTLDRSRQDKVQDKSLGMTLHRHDHFLNLKSLARSILKL